ncbi:hypothetical protein E2C06_33460 [Dankookia rubra]|uniref:Recombinase domain-containing protein n=1 Tax=Dankookia rubra TaxID=1442381 RepID=A0A4R5Q5X2_9PROT|nr:hypothetical protein E2C06_33460 [Dankookia rubra]
MAEGSVAGYAAAGGGAAAGRGGASLGAIGRALHERGVPRPRGGSTWTHTTVARVLARAAI